MENLSHEENALNDFTPSQKLINAQRQENSTYFSEQASTQNGKRNIFDKILRRNTVSEVDMAHEEALRINGFVDLNTLREKYSETKKSIDLILSQPGINEALANGDFDGVTQIAKRLPEYKKDDGYKILIAAREIIARQIGIILVSGDSEKIEELFLKNSGNYFELDELPAMPHEILGMPEAKQKLLNIIKSGNKTLSWTKTEPSMIAETAKKIINLGLLSEEEVQNFIHSEEFATSIFNDVIETLETNSKDPIKAKERIDSYIETGLLDKNTAQEMMASQAFLDSCQNTIIRSLWRTSDQNEKRVAMVEDGFNKLVAAGLVNENVAYGFTNSIHKIAQANPKFLEMV